MENLFGGRSSIAAYCHHAVIIPLCGAVSTQLPVSSGAQMELLVYESPRGGEPESIPMTFNDFGVWTATVRHHPVPDSYKGDYKTMP